MEKHSYYKPSEYEQMLLAAKWISIEDIDDDYRKYAHKNPDAMSYSQWVASKQEWDDLNAQFMALEKKHGMGRVWQLEDNPDYDTAHQILEDMGWLEVCLGY